MFRKRWRKILAASLVVGTLAFAPEIYDVKNFSVVHAEVKLYTAMGVDYGNELESQEIVKLRARDKAIKNAVKQAGVYLKTYSRSVNSELTDDEITAITSNAYELVGEPKYNRVIKQVSDQITLIVWEVTVDVNVDDGEITKWYKRNFEERSNLISQTRETNEAAAENDKKVEDLRKRANNITDEAGRAQLKKEFEQADNDFLYNQKIEEGNRFYYDSYYEKALNSFSEAIKIDPNNAKAYERRADTYKRSGELDSALNEINAAIKLAPKESSYYEKRAYLYIDLKQFDKAIADFNKMIELDPKSSNGYYGRACVYDRLSMKEKYIKAIENSKYRKKALEEYTKAIEANSRYTLAYYHRAYVYKNLGQHDKALADINKMVEVASLDEIYFDKIDAYKYRAKFYTQLGQYDKALTDLTECINLETDYEKKAKAYIHRSQFYGLTLKQFDKANADEETAVELYTQAIASSTDAKKISSYYTSRASLHKLLNRYDDALADYTKTIELNPRGALAYNFRADLYKELKRYDEAFADYEKAIELEPGNEFMYQDLGELYEKLKQYDKAIADYTKVIELFPTSRDCGQYMIKYISGEVECHMN